LEAGLPFNVDDFPAFAARRPAVGKWRSSIAFRIAASSFKRSCYDHSTGEEQRLTIIGDEAVGQGETMATQSRRYFMRRSLIGLAALPLGTRFLASNAFAADLPRLDPDNAQARALDYVEDASQAEGHEAWEEGRSCSSCRFFQADTEGCQLFPEYSVEPNGWCKSWIEKG
jgi:hypothetical protein